MLLWIMFMLSSLPVYGQAGVGAVIGLLAVKMLRWTWVWGTGCIGAWYCGRSRLRYHADRAFYRLESLRCALAIQTLTPEILEAVMTTWAEDRGFKPENMSRIRRLMQRWEYRRQDGQE